MIALILLSLAFVFGCGAICAIKQPGQHWLFFLSLSIILGVMAYEY